jgi:hypothetical protein
VVCEARASCRDADLSEVSEPSTGAERGRRSDRPQVGRRRTPARATISSVAGEVPDAPTICQEQSLVFFIVCQICQFCQIEK